MASRSKAKAGDTPEANDSVADVATADAFGAHADGVADPSQTPAPETGDDTAHGQAGPLHPGQVAPEGGPAGEDVSTPVSAGNAGYGIANVPSNLNRDGAKVEAPLQGDAVGAHRDGNPDPGSSDAPETGDDYEKGQARRLGQVAPTNKAEMIAGSENPDGAKVDAPWIDDARGAHADAHDDSPSPMTGDDFAAGQAIRLGQVAPLDGGISHAATVGAIGSPYVGHSPSSAVLEPPKQRIAEDDKRLHQPRLADGGVIALADQGAGLLIDEATDSTPDPDAMFKPYTVVGDAQVSLMRLHQRGHFGMHTNQQLVLAAGAVVSGMQAAMLKARVKRQAAEGV